MEKEEIKEIVISNVKALVETLPSEQQFEVNEDTVLFGKGSLIDSLSLVSIIVDLETVFSIDYGYDDISLTDDRAMTRKQSPFDSVTTMVDYIDELINQN
jgi:acyl carrier protein